MSRKHDKAFIDASFPSLMAILLQWQLRASLNPWIMELYRILESSLMVRQSWSFEMRAIPAWNNLCLSRAFAPAAGEPRCPISSYQQFRHAPCGLVMDKVIEIVADLHRRGWIDVDRCYARIVLFKTASYIAMRFSTGTSP